MLRETFTNTIDKEQGLLWINRLYMVLLATFFLIRIYWNTMFPLGSFLNRYLTCLVYATSALILAKLLLFHAYEWWEILISIGLVFVFYMVYLHIGQKIWMLCTPLFIIGAKGIEADKLLRLHMICVGGMLLLAYTASCLGVIENLAYDIEPSRPVRYAMGMSYPTTFSEFVLYFVLDWGYLRRKKYSVLDFLGMGSLALILKVKCDAKTDMILVLMAMAIFVLYRHQVCKKIMGMKFPVILSMGMMPILAGIMIKLTYSFDWEYAWMVKLNRILNDRLKYGRIGLNIYSCNTLWGQVVKYITTGRKVEIPSDYFNLDCSYVMLLINYGVIMLLLILFLHFMIGIRAIKAKEVLIVWIITVIALQSVMENRLFMPQYNSFILLLFTKLSSDTCKD